MVTPEILVKCAKLSMASYMEVTYINFAEFEVDLVKKINSTKTGTQGFVAVDNTKKVLYIVFRGTDQFTDLKMNFKFQQVPIATRCGKGSVHLGFLEAFQSVKKQILQLDFSIYEDYEIVITGHSLGGALATLAGSMPFFKKLIHVVTFGSPKVGDKKFVSAFNKCIDSTRIVFEADPVTELPPLPQYHHVSGELRIDSEGRELATYGFFTRVWKTFLAWVKRKKVSEDSEVISFHDHSRLEYVKALEKRFAK
jgi:hypothetical protein